MKNEIMLFFSLSILMVPFFMVQGGESPSDVKTLASQPQIVVTDPNATYLGAGGLMTALSTWGYILLQIFRKNTNGNNKIYTKEDTQEKIDALRNEFDLSLEGIRTEFGSKFTDIFGSIDRKHDSQMEAIHNLDKSIAVFETNRKNDTKILENFLKSQQRFQDEFNKFQINCAGRHPNYTPDRPKQ